MKTYLIFLLLFSESLYSQTNIDVPFIEGIMYSRTSFPGNVFNESLRNINFNEDVSSQLKTLQKNVQHNSTVASAGKVTGDPLFIMAALMAPLQATMYFTLDRAFAKAEALGYTFEAIIDNREDTGMISVIARDKSEKGSVTFSLPSFHKVWQKENIGPDYYTIKETQESEVITGYTCQKIIFTRKDNSTISNTGFKTAFKVSVWATDKITSRINFQHPFYLDVDKGILKIEVEYDKKGIDKLLYEITGIEHKKLDDSDFLIQQWQPTINFDTNEGAAGLMFMSIMMKGLQSISQ